MKTAVVTGDLMFLSHPLPTEKKKGVLGGVERRTLHSSYWLLSGSTASIQFIFYFTYFYGCSL